MLFLSVFAANTLDAVKLGNNRYPIEIGYNLMVAFYVYVFLVKEVVKLIIFCY